MHTYNDFMNTMYQELGTNQPTKLAVIGYYINHLDKLVETHEVSFMAMARLVLSEQQSKDPDLTIDDAIESVNAVMKKRNVQFDFLMAIDNDLRAQSNEMMEPLQSIVKEDRGTFGTDEQLALETAGIYGTIGITNFGYLDRDKPGFIKALDQLGKTNPDITTTFIDDMFSAVIAAAEARCAHRRDKGFSRSEQANVIPVN